jgi:hypothetical protein
LVQPWAASFDPAATKRDFNSPLHFQASRSHFPSLAHSQSKLTRASKKRLHLEHSRSNREGVQSHHPLLVMTALPYTRTRHRHFMGFSHQRCDKTAISNRTQCDQSMI